MAQDMEKSLGQAIVIDNRQGGGGAVGTAVVAKSPADGYTFGFGYIGVLVTLPLMQKGLPYDPWKELAPVSLIYDVPLYISAGTDSGLKSLKDVLDASRKKPGGLTVGNPALGSTAHLFIELLKEQAGVELTPVAYKGDAPAVLDLLAGRLDLSSANIAVLGPHIKAGTVRLLFQLGDRRSAHFPDLPTAKEQGFSRAVASSWAGVVVPAGTPPGAVAKLNEALLSSMKTPAGREIFTRFSLDPIGSSPREFDDFLHAEQRRWGPIIKRLNLTLD